MDSTTPAQPTQLPAFLRGEPERLFRTVFALNLVLMVMPIWTTQWLPLQDLGGHIELMDVMHRYGDEELAFYATYTRPGWFDPNSLSLGIAWLLGPLIGTVAVSKLLLSFYIIGLPLSLAAVARTFGRSPWLVLLGSPLIFNAMLNVGFINYLIAMPLMFWMIPLAMKVARNEAWRDALILGLCAILLFYAHVIAFLIGWSMAAFILALYGKRRSWFLGWLATVPALVMLGFWIDRMFLDPVATELGRTFGTSDRGLATTHKTLSEKFATFHAWGSNFFRDNLDEIALSMIALFWAGAFAFSPKEPAPKTTQAIDGVRRYGLEVITLICVGAYLLLPSGANEIAILAERIPIMIIVFLLLWPRLEVSRSIVRWSLIPLTLGVMTYPFLVQSRFTQFEQEEIGSLEDVVSQLEMGTKLAYVIEKPTSDITFMKPLWHLPKAMHAVHQGGISHDSFAIRPYTPIQYKSGQSPTRVRPRFARTASVYEYDYILIQARTTPAYMFKREGVDFVTNKEEWWLFKVSDPDSDSIVIRSPGRGGFRDLFNCPPGMVLRGLKGERLSVIGNLRAHCSEYSQIVSDATEMRSTRKTKSRLHRSPVYGRPMAEGHAWESVCAKNEAIAGFRGRHDDFLPSLEVICRPIRPGKRGDYVLQAIPDTESANFSVTCPDGTVATGYRGRSGLFIDQVGLRCEPLP